MAEKELTWTTWEELLLACAVKRHGVKNWDSVAMELQNRSPLPLLLTAQVCENRYLDLKSRFMDHTDHEHDEVDTIPWLEDLRKLRVAELKQEVHRYDLSIQSLQLKVKRLEEERERSLKENENDDGKPDLEKNLEEDRSENDKGDGAEAPEDYLPEHAAGDGSDRENRSFNESNSTGNRGAGVEEEQRESEPVQTRDVKPDPASSDSKPAVEDSYNDSSDTVAKHAAEKSSQEKKGGDPAELHNSAGESKEGMKESSDVQSSASLTRKRRREREVSGGRSRGGDEPVVSPATIKREVVKSEPLVGLLDIIRSHKHGSIFERRLENQKTDGYKKMVRLHVDLEIIRTRVRKGSYSSCPTRIYRDLLLLFINAIVFFPKASTEFVAAHELLDLVLEDLKKKKRSLRSDSSPEPAPSKPTLLQPKPDPERPDSLLAKHKSSAPIVVCRKRSSISAKSSNAAAATETQTDEKPTPNPKPPVKNPPNGKEEQSPIKVKTKERPVTGARSMRRNNNKGRGDQKSTPNNKNSLAITNPSPSNSSVDEKGEADLKTGNKKKLADVTVKKRCAADFLKRIKRNSPSKETLLLDTLKTRGSYDNNNGGRREQQKRRAEGQKEPPPVSKRSGGGGGGGGAGKQAKEDSSASKRSVGRPPKKGTETGATKRGREGGGAQAASKQAQKRARR